MKLRAHAWVSILNNPTLAKCLTDTDYLLKSDLSVFASKQRLHSCRNTSLIDPTRKGKMLLFQRDIRSHFTPFF